jgi:hypothetical protein
MNGIVERILEFLIGKHKTLLSYQYAARLFYGVPEVKLDLSITVCNRVLKLLLKL